MKTHPIQLDRKRQLRFDNKAIRALDIELTKEYGHGFAYFTRSLGEGDFNFDVLVRALRYGLAHDPNERLSEDRICDLIGAHGDTEFVLWNAVAEAYTAARSGMRVQYDAEEDGGVPPDEVAPALGEAPAGDEE